jgi:hypothetical protein
MTGRNEFNDVLYLIDFGLSKKYIDPKTGEHVKFKNNHRLNGTARFASIHALEGYELSRRDDLESLGYVLVYLLKGNLPWTRIKNKNKYEKYKVILNMKKKMSEDILIGDKNNSEFIDFLKYCRNLKFEEAPDYNYLRGLMTKCISKNNKINDIMGSKNDIFEHSLIIDTSLNKIYKNKKRTCSVKRVKINLVSNKLLNANKRNEITDLDNKIINETKSGTLAYIGKKVRNYSCYKKSDIKFYQKLYESKKKQTSFNDSSDDDDVNVANNLKFISIKYINNFSTNNCNDANQNINKKKTTFKDNASTASSSNENKKYSLTKLDLIKKGLGIEPKKTQMIKGEENLEKNDEENKDDGCIIL